MTDSFDALKELAIKPEPLYLKIRRAPRRLWARAVDAWYTPRHWVQRAHRGYSDRDLWSFDYNLASTISKGLRHMAATTHGCPGSYLDKYAQDWMNPTSEESDAAFAAWETDLIVMAEGFDTAMKIINMDYDFKDPDAEAVLEEEFKEAGELFIKHFFSLWT